MKVAIVTPVLSHFEVPLFRMAAGLPGLDVRVMHTDPSHDAFYSDDYGQVIDWGETLRAGYVGSCFPGMKELSADLFAWKPRVVLQYGYSWPGALAFVAKARARGLRMVHRGLLTPYHNRRGSTLASLAWRRLLPTLLRRFHAHHYGGTYSELVLERAGIPRDRRYFVPFSIDTPYFAARADAPAMASAALDLRRRLGWAPDAPVLLFMCQHSYFKAPDVMLRIAANAQAARPDLKLIMAGSGVMTDQLKTTAADLLSPGSFEFPGFVESKRTMPYYLAADLVMFPSRYDTWSRGVNEAMLARRPCILSRVVPAAGGLVDHGANGYVVDGLEPEPFAECIDRFLSLPAEHRRRMGEAARTRALEFSYEAHRDDLYRSLTEVAA